MKIHQNNVSGEYMEITKSRNLKKDLKKIRLFSSIIDKKLSQHDKEASKIENFSLEQLQDLSQLVRAADYVVSKYEDKKEVYLLLKDFVDMINYSTTSMDIINDKITEMVVSAENAISRIKNLQGDVSDNFSLNSSKSVMHSKKEISCLKQVEII